MDGEKSATCKVSVQAESAGTISVTGVSVTDKEISLEEGKEQTLTATVSPSNATNKAVTWGTLDPSIATVDQNGKVTAVAEGSTVITVTTADGAYNTYVLVKVTAKPSTIVEVEGVTLDAKTLNLTEGENKTLTATVLPANATNKKVTWESIDTSVATVDQNGKVTGVKAGSTTVVVYTEDGNQQAYCTVTVVAKQTTEQTTQEPVTIDATGLKLNVSSEMTLALKKTKNITATVLPANATNKSVTFTSSNKSVATVTSSGKVKAVAPGIAVITVKTANNISKKITIKVKPAKVTSIKAKKVSKSKVKLMWKKQSKVTGYKVYRLNTKTNKYKLYKITKNNYISVANLKKNITYMFKVKAYKRSGSKVVNGDASAVAKVKMK